MMMTATKNFVMAIASILFLLLSTGYSMQEEALLPCPAYPAACNRDADCYFPCKAHGYPPAHAHCVRNPIGDDPMFMCCCKP